MDKEKFIQHPALQATTTVDNRAQTPPRLRLAVNEEIFPGEVNQARGYAICTVLQPKIRTRWTNFTYPLDGPEQYQEMLSALAQDQARNDLIADDVKNELAREAGACLVVSDRAAHLAALQTNLLNRGLEMALLTGKVPPAQDEAVVAQIRSGKIKILGATAQLIGEGFDCPGLSSLFLVMPIKLHGKLLQVAGKIIRPQAGKVPLLYDYKDPIDVLMAASRVRAEAYGRYTRRVFGNKAISSCLAQNQANNCHRNFNHQHTEERR